LKKAFRECTKGFFCAVILKKLITDMKIETLYSLFIDSSGICTDTRDINPSSLFFALKGDNFNGNKFAIEALIAGAGYAIVDEVVDSKDERVIQVENVLSTLQELATFHREKLNIPVIAITGSNGKTTTKELLNVVLAKKFKVAFTKGNLNNHIGVPLTLLEVTSAHDIALIEMGDNHRYEVELLCEIAKPNFGFVTNVGKDHLEGFGSFANNILAKKEVFDFLKVNGGKVFLDESDELVTEMVGSDIDVISYGKKSSFSHIHYLRSNPLVVFSDVLGNEVETKLFGAFNFNNIKLAYCVGKYFEVPLPEISTALMEFQPDNNRSQVLNTDRNTLIMDAYNANPSSVAEAVSSFAEMETDKVKVLILGDMFELGSYSVDEHQNMAALAMSKGFDDVLLIGENYSATKNIAKQSLYLTKSEAEVYLKKIAPEGAIILLKGSRGMKLESLKPVL
jgi:UDP-N-acetylmuramoyl-tripeptide--D-alanyl-D-alanine ligase